MAKAVKVHLLFQRDSGHVKNYLTILNQTENGMKMTFCILVIPKVKNLSIPSCSVKDRP